MKKFLVFTTAVSLLFACNNSKDNKPTNTDTSQSNTNTNTTTPTTDMGPLKAGNVSFTVDGKETTARGSLLVTKDKDKLQPGSDYLVIMTVNAPNSENLVLNFVLDLKPGTYPVVGMSYGRGSGDNGQQFGGILGGQPKLTDYKVNVTDVKDLGSNNMGGHRWSISGNFEDVTIPAMKVMLYDKTKNHPEQIKVEKTSFTNLTFDDNQEEMINKAFEKTQNK